MAHEPVHVSEIFFSCTTTKYMAKEYSVPEHALSHIYEGSMVVDEGDRTHTFGPGSTILFRRNRLGRVTKVPVNGGTCKSVTVFITQDFLQQYYAGQPIHMTSEPPGEGILTPHPLLNSLFDSLLPYYNLVDGLPEGLAGLKLRELMAILHKVAPETEAILADFAEPGKIDLAGFMQKNFSFNIPNERFAYLTGRSLATFKRDFQKTFSMSPQKWLQQKRLEHAYYLIARKHVKPSDAYMEAGFENLSHFSRVFKQFFGYPPSHLSVSVTANHS